MNLEKIFEKALKPKFLSFEEGLALYKNAPLSELIAVANELRKKHKPESKIVTWQIDRNVNITNVCISQCKFCNFYCRPGAENAYITSIDEYRQKIEALFKKGGNQLLLQGGLHPKLGIDFYTALFSDLKTLYPELKLHALGPPEVVHIAKISKLSYRQVLEKLIDAGLDSLPGAGAEILSDRVRKIISPNKCNTQQWLNVMREAHKLNLLTSATMMFGHLENKAERIKHLILLRDVQAEKPASSKGFLAFIPWPFQDKNTQLTENFNVNNQVYSNEYIKTIAISRILLSNIPNIQASWLTVGKDTAQVCLHAGANDFGSIMIEENVVSSAGAHYKFDAEGIQKAIREAGFIPRLRNQKYEYLDYKTQKIKYGK